MEFEERRGIDVYVDGPGPGDGTSGRCRPEDDHSQDCDGGSHQLRSLVGRGCRDFRSLVVLRLRGFGARVAVASPAGKSGGIALPVRRIELRQSRQTKGRFFGTRRWGPGGR